MNLLTETEKAYIAGLFDGEGSIGLYHKKASKNGIDSRLIGRE